MSVNELYNSDNINNRIATIHAYSQSLGNLTPNQVLVTDTNRLLNTVPYSTFQGTPTSPYSCGLGQPFPTIQAAINQAVLDGHSAGNPTAVFCAPQTFIEDIICAEGINICALSVNGTRLQGSATINVNNSLSIENILFLNTTKSIIINGLNNGAIFFNNCSFIQLIGPDPILELNNPNTNTFFNNCVFQGLDNIKVMDILSTGLCLIKNCLGISSSIFNIFGGTVILMNNVFNSVFFTDGATSLLAILSSLIISDSAANWGITCNNSSTCFVINSVLQCNPLFGAIDGDNTATFARNNVIAPAGVTTIQNVNVISLPLL